MPQVVAQQAFWAWHRRRHRLVRLLQLLVPNSLIHSDRHLRGQFWLTRPVLQLLVVAACLPIVLRPHRN